MSSVGATKKGKRKIKFLNLETKYVWKEGEERRGYGNHV